MKNIYLLKKFSELFSIDILYTENNTLNILSNRKIYSPVYINTEFRRRLITMASTQNAPYIYIDIFQAYYCCINVNGLYIIIGPMHTQPLEDHKLHSFYSHYRINQSNTLPIHVYHTKEVYDIIGIISNTLLDATYEPEELALINNILPQSTTLSESNEKQLFHLELSSQPLPSYQYYEDRKFIDLVREGNVQEAIEHNMKIDNIALNLSQDALMNYHNMSITEITLCTGAVIASGLSPNMAYRISAFYMQKLDTCDTVEEIVQCRIRAIEDLIQHLQKNKQSHCSSNYTGRCKDYIEEHYSEKIYLHDVANALDINQNYLSRIFKKEEGISFQEFIIKTRIKNAAKLLIYSDESLASIAEDVNFSSQSYMGKMFIKYKGMTPKEYRNHFRNDTQYFYNDSIS